MKTFSFRLSDQDSNSHSPTAASKEHRLKHFSQTPIFFLLIPIFISDQSTPWMLEDNKQDWKTIIPMIQDIYRLRIRNQAGTWHKLCWLLPSSRSYRTLLTKTMRSENSLFPQARSPHKPTVNHMNICRLGQKHLSDRMHIHIWYQ